MEDCLIIGINISKGQDISCMTVARKNGEEMHVINQLFNKEAEDMYYKLINIHAIGEEAINRCIRRIQNIYSYKDILETIKVTKKLKKYAEEDKEYILNYNTSRKIQEILAAFWLTYTNDEFYNYFGFNWIPPKEIQEKARKTINMNGKSALNYTIIKKADIESVIKPREILKNIEDELTISSKIKSKNFKRRYD